MGLSTNLISQFVKATKDTTTTKKETTLYGEVVFQDGKNYVRLDGSSVLTPVNTNVVIDNGNRVSVMIKNHVATVVGNDTVKSNQISNPISDNSIVRVDAVIADLINANKINANNITASNAEINTLKTANVTVQGTLKAHQAVIDDLDATYARLDELDARYITTEELEASYITADEIDANYAKISELESTYATIESLVAVEGDIATLNSEVATIDNLMFGSATGNVIQTSFANAVIAQLGDAQIKSAMIAEIDAGKILTGTLDTNKIAVSSEDGSLYIAGNLIQFKEGDDVRIQIGKDASGAYSILICDADGNVLLNTDGITKDAIPDQLIVNAMVSDTANIHASKLDIDSLFSEINDSSNTIKSTKVYLDDKKQTLDLAFKTLTDEVGSQGQTISSQGTAISTIQGQISSKIWQQDIDVAKNEMSTQYSTLEQNLDGFKATVNSTTNTLGTRMTTMEQTAEGLSVEIDNLEIGGRNYILSSATMAGGAASNGIALTHQDDGSIKVVTASGNGNWHSWYQPSVANANLSDGDEFTFSVDVKCDEGSTGKPKIYIKNGMGYYAMQGTATTEYTRLYYTGTWVSTNDVRFHFGWNETVGTFYVRRPKLEKGNRCTDWAPAPEDIESDILDASKTATNYLNFSSSGLVIGDLTSSTLGKNVLIDSDSVDIRNGTTTLASFGADYLYLAKNSRNAKIDLCNGLATLYHESKYSYDTIFIIDTGNTTEIMGLINPLCITSVDDLDQVSIQFANANGVMGGVGIVGSWLRRFGSNMFDTYTILDSGNYDEVMDSGWFYGGAIGDGFSIYANDTQIQYRKIGKIVHIRGAVKPTTDIAGSTTSYTLFTLPEGYRPSAPVYARCQGSAANTWLLSVTAAGAVRFSRYGYGSTYVTATAGTWLPFDVTFFID